MREYRRAYHAHDDFEARQPSGGGLFIVGVRLLMLLFCLLSWVSVLLGLNAWYGFW